MLGSCDQVLEHVDDYWHDLLTPQQSAEVAGHCERCPTCKSALDEAEKRRDALLNASTGEAPERLIRATLARIVAAEGAPAPPPRWLWKLAGAVAACVAVLALVHVYFVNLSSSPYDLTLFGQARLVPGTPASLRVRLVHHEHGKGVSGVPVTVELLDPGGAPALQLVRFLTDEQGTGSPRFPLPEWADGDYRLRVTAEAPGGDQVLIRTVQLRQAWKLLLTSDRPVYQPGQDIHVRALALRRLNLRPMAGQEAVFTITDPKRNVIFKQTQPTSKFGIGAVDCPLAEEIAEGTYTIGCQVGDTKSNLAVEVKKYVLPRFKVEVTAERPFYLPGQRVRGKVQARYFFGKPVADAVVDVALDVGENVKLRTDGRGEASFDFPPLPARGGAEPAHVELAAVVTDSAGQRETRRSSLVIAAQPLRIELMPEGGTLVADVPNTIYVLVSTPDGRPARARVIVSGRDQELATDGHGVATFELNPGPGEVVGRVRAIGPDGESSREFRLTCGQVEYNFLLRTDRAVYSAGDTVRLTAVGGDTEPVLVDLLKDGQTLLTAVLPMSDGHGAGRIELPAEVFGTLELYAYRAAGTAIPARQSRVLFVRPPAALHIQTTLDRNEYRPGGRARLSIALTGANGEPVPGALSIAAVDEAVFALSDQTSETDPIRSATEPSLLAPVLASQRWSPTAAVPGAGQEQLEKALFARAANQRRTVNREEFMRELLPFLENDKSVFEVLKRPDWEKLLPPDFPADALAILRNESTMHTLIGSSYPESVRETEALRTAGMHLVQTIWFFVGIVTVISASIAALILLCRHYRAVDVGVGIGLVSVCCCLMVPSVQKVREASERTMVLNQLNHIWIAVEDFRGVHRKLPSPTPGPDGEPTTPRVRAWFPETLLWRPELITDDAGRASLDLDLADSITTWRLTAGAVSADGRLGAAQAGIKVFQPFFVELNLPVALTRNDEVSVPVVLYNYLDRPQQVELKLEAAAWFRLLGEPVQRLDLEAGAVRSTHYRLRVEQVGRHELQVTALGSGVADAVKRPIEVVPDGRRVEKVWSGTLDQPAEIALNLPPGAIDGSSRLLVKIAPSTFSQLVDGLDGILQLPYGCFEQTSSTTYPNVLALDYLRRVKKSAPAIEDRARHYIHLGYQRLLGFEVPRGGFDWFGRPPANRTLTAYGLMEFEDMVKVHEVDASLIQRTRKWLLDQRRPDGSWDPEGHVPQNLPAGQDGSALARLRTTAYIGWAVGRNAAPGQADATCWFLLDHRPEAIHDPYTLALVVNALLALSPGGKSAAPYVDRLAALRQTSADGKRVWWQQREQDRTAFHGSGPAGDVETTALAALALIEAHDSPAAVSAALGWLIEQRGSSGVWPSTQATVLALKALLAGTGHALGGGERRLELALDGGKPRTVVIAADQAEVVKLIDLTGELTAGRHTLRLRRLASSAATYQVVFRYHEPGEDRQPQEPLSIAVEYENRELRTGNTLSATATVTNRMPDAAPMLLVELPIPAGFQLEVTDLDRLVAAGTVAKYQVQPTRALLYLRELKAGGALAVPYRLRAQMPVDIRAPAARVYEYYNPARQGFSTSKRLVVAS
jgi:hypothetical protein